MNAGRPGLRLRPVEGVVPPPGRLEKEGGPMEIWTDERQPRKSQTALKALGIILAYSAVIIGYLVLAIWGPAGAP